jgi:hypothetical protein
MKLTIINKTHLLILIAVLFSCKKEKKQENKGLIPTVENLAGTWTLQKTHQYVTKANGDVIPGGGTFAKEPNVNYYIFMSDGSYTEKSMLQDGSNYVYTKNGSYKIIESNWDGEKVKHINFDNYSKINNIIRFIDADYLEIYNYGGDNGLYSNTTDYYVRVK